MRVAAALAVSFVAVVAHAAPTRFAGPHPVAERAGGGYCYIEAPHLHSYAPDHAVFYRATPAGWAFIGDPTPFGYAGERYIFYGHHPVAADVDGPVFCFIDGPHYHASAPAGARGDYEIVDGVAFYVGSLPVAYVDARAARWKQVNDELLPFDRFRPVVHVTPPEAWRGRTYTPGVKIKLPKRRPDRVRKVRVQVR